MSDEKTSIEVRREDARYEVVVDGVVAGFTEVHEQPDGVWSFPHTVVEKAYEGQGLASRLVRGALDDVRAHGRQVAPKCPYVRNWVAKHPEYRDLVADPTAFDL